MTNPGPRSSTQTQDLGRFPKRQSGVQARLREQGCPLWSLSWAMRW